jgi:cytosine/adenosine deaminase-related metal-dependent hydrolase
VLAQADAGAQTGVMTAPSGPAAPVAPGRPLLIRGATILSMDPQVGTLDAGDILVRDGRIAAVGRRIEAADTQVVEGAGRIALPGFVNSHIHLAQAILRGLAGDATLDEYFKRIVARYTRHLQPEDLGASNYAGALEQLSAGTTTIFDWSREALTPAHADAIVDAAERSGIRAFFGYGVTGPGQGGVAIRADVERLRRGRLSSDDGRVRLALALRGPDSSPMEEAEDDFRFARDLGLLHQFHVGVLLYSQRQRRGVAQLAEKGLIGPGAILVHANDLDPDEYRITAEKGAAISVTPEVEMMMGHGQPATGRALQAGHRPALGVDVVTGVGGDMFSQMRTALSAQRLADNLAAAAAAKPLAAVSLTARQVLEAATIDGAKALGIEKEVGSLAPGKRADLILLRADELATAPMRDPVGTVVLQATPASVDMVLVEGETIKAGGRLIGRDPARAVAELSERARELDARVAAAAARAPG